ncbi:MAG: glycoside hydrolase family 9 protein [Lachnospiraceae bacterium]|nr:glycoside hydrolase family 9 protein [Lachnospiraceae bacterium]
MKDSFLKLLEESRDIHRVIPPDRTKTNTARLEKKVPSETRLLSDMSSLDGWSKKTPYVELSISDKVLFEGKKTMLMACPTNLPDWLPDHARGRIYEEPGALFTVDRENWEDWNRLSFYVYPDIHGTKSINIRLQPRNDGVLKSPDAWGRTGHHNVSLVPFEWNHVTLEIPMVPRDCVTGVSIEYDMCGHENDSDDVLHWYLSTLELQKVDADKEEGWTPKAGLLSVSGAGYTPKGLKYAAAEYNAAAEGSAAEYNAAAEGSLAAEFGGDAETYFTVERWTETEGSEGFAGETVFRGSAEKVTIGGETFAMMDFTALQTEGTYVVRYGALQSELFDIAVDAYEPLTWKILNFYLSQRCGHYVRGKHMACHTDMLLVHGKKSIVANGGWHDAADLAQGMGNTADGTAALFLLAERIREKNPRLYDRVLEEAEWGLDYVLKVRFGDGFRSDYSSTSIWTDGIIGTSDDIISEANEMPYLNFVSAFAEACGAHALRDEDPVRADYALKIAAEDFGFAEAQCERGNNGDPTVRMEHFEVKMFAAACSAAAALFCAGRKEFLGKAAHYAALLLDCQQQEMTDWEIPLSGFYYTDCAHTLPWHHAHHSFEQYAAAGLEILIREAPEHPDAEKWLAAEKRTARYYKTIAEYTKPYGLLPEGVYFADEAERQPDETLKGIIWPDEYSLPGFRPQVEKGIVCLDREKGVFLRAFPVWFSFRGNCAVQLSEAAAAASAAQLTGDEELTELCAQQLHWLTGGNPFGQSLIYGEGHEWSDEYTIQPGVTVGQIPVGVQTYLDHDSPWWPQVATATYKEVWISPANKLMWLLSYIL